jgi:hypothetical protein
MLESTRNKATRSAEETVHVSNIAVHYQLLMFCGNDSGTNISDFIKSQLLHPRSKQSFSFKSWCSGL